MTRIIVLAIDPGTREFGFAVFKGKDLDDSGVKSLRRSGSQHSRLAVLARVFTELIEKNKPRMLALEKNSFDHIGQNQNLMKAIGKMRSIAKRRGIPTFEFAANTIKKIVAGDACASKNTIAQVICARYPHLKANVGHRYSWQERYYLNMFDAIACGLTFLSLQESHQLQRYVLDVKAS